jgi:hypothetical protein
MSNLDSTPGYDPHPSNTLTAFYEDRDTAEEAVQRLVATGINQASIRLVEGDDTLDASAASNEHGKGFWESIGDFLFPSADREVYSEGLRRGGFLVTVANVTGEVADKALDILDDEGSVDIDERAASWRSEGWSPITVDDTGSSEYAADDPATSTGDDASAASGENVNELEADLEEERRLRRDLTTGRSRARSYISYK